jgi:hypothetical protein
VSSATARLRAFSCGYRDSSHLTGGTHQKARSRPASGYHPIRKLLENVRVAGILQAGHADIHAGLEKIAAIEAW